MRKYSSMPISEVSIGGISIGEFESPQSVINYMFELLDRDGFSSAIAINAEKIIAASNSDELFEIIMSCNIRYADGIGVVKAIKSKSGRLIPRLPGCEIWESLMDYAGANNIPVFLVGGKTEVIEKTKDKLQQAYQTPVIGFQNGYFENESQLIADIKASGAKIVTVAMGSPRQEQFIFSCREAGIKAVFMGVGGTYDVFTGNVKRAPLFWQNMGLEWLYRLLSQPTRWRRQLNLIHFMWLYFTKRL